MSSDKLQITGRHILIVGFYTLFMIIMTMNLILFPACAPEAMQTYGIEQQGLTTLSSVTSLVGLFAGLLFGPMLDRGNVKRTIAIWMAIGVAFFFIRYFLNSYIAVLLLTFLASMCIGIVQISANKVLDTWFPPENVSVAFSLQAAAAGIGSAIAFMVGAALGLKNFLLLIAILYAILLVIWLVGGGVGDLRPEGVKPPKGATAMAWKSKYTWFLAIAASACVGSTLLLNTYSITSNLSRGMTPEQAALFGTVMNLSLMLGGYLGSFLLGVIKRYNVCNILFFVGGGLFFCLSWFLPLGPATFICIAIGGLILGNGIGVNVGRVALVPLTGSFPTEVVGTAAGAVEGIKSLITFIIPIAVAAACGTNYTAIYIVFAVHCLVGVIFGGLLMPELGPNGKLQQEAKAQAEQA